MLAEHRELQAMVAATRQSLQAESSRHVEEKARLTEALEVQRIALQAAQRERDDACRGKWICSEKS